MDLLRLLLFVGVCVVAQSANIKRVLFEPPGGGPFSHLPIGGGPVQMSGGSSSHPYRACLPQQMYCGLNCPYGYMKGGNGCDFCVCMSHPQGTGVSTKSPAHVTPGTSSSSANAKHVTTSRGTTTNQAAARTSVAPSVGPDRCAIAVTLCERQCPVGGYLTDPDDCTFCVCKKDVIGTGNTYTP